MNKLHFAAIATVLSGACASVGAVDMNAMDTNGDQMISKQEYMKYYEAMYERMDKSGKGMMPMKDMKMAMRDGMMSTDKAKGHMMMKDDKAMQGYKK